MSWRHVFCLCISALKESSSCIGRVIIWCFRSSSKPWKRSLAVAHFLSHEALVGWRKVIPPSQKALKEKTCLSFLICVLTACERLNAIQGVSESQGRRRLLHFWHHLTTPNPPKVIGRENKNPSCLRNQHDALEDYIRATNCKHAFVSATGKSAVRSAREARPIKCTVFSGKVFKKKMIQIIIIIYFCYVFI